MITVKLTLYESKTPTALHTEAITALQRMLGPCVLLFCIERRPMPMLECYFASVVEIDGSPALHATLITDWAYERARRALAQMRDSSDSLIYNEDTEYGYFTIEITP